MKSWIKYAYYVGWGGFLLHGTLASVAWMLRPEDMAGWLFPTLSSLTSLLFVVGYMWPKLEMEKRLDSAAQWHSEHMAELAGRAAGELAEAVANELEETQ